MLLLLLSSSSQLENVEHTHFAACVCGFKTRHEVQALIITNQLNQQNSMDIFRCWFLIHRTNTYIQNRSDLLSSQSKRIDILASTIKLKIFSPSLCTFSWPLLLLLRHTLRSCVLYSPKVGRYV